MIGEKYSKDKLPIYTFLMQFKNALKEVAKCSQAGHNKYPLDKDWKNFERVENAQFEYMNASIRHLFEEGVNQDMLEYGNITHKAQVIWNLLAALEVSLKEENVKDDPLTKIINITKDITNDQLLGTTIRQIVNEKDKKS